MVRNADDNGYDFVSKCGHRTGWPDESMKELAPECVAAGCKLGFSVVQFAGMIVSERERNMHDDSDFFATWFDKDTGESGEVMVGSTRGWTYFNGSSIDADEETRAAWNAACDRAAAAARQRAADRAAAEEAKTPSKGKRVRVTSKRSKVEHGTEGVVFWYGNSSYGGMRVGFKTDDGQKHFCAATCVEIIEQVEA